MIRTKTGFFAIGSVILLGAGVATLSRAQQPPAPPARGVEEKPSREKHAALRAEVDLLQLQYTAASTVLQEALRRTEEFDIVRGVNHLTPFELKGRYLELVSGRQTAINVPSIPGAGGEQRSAEASAAADSKKLDDAWRAALAEKKKAFLQLSATLHEKSLELSIYEKMHEESR